MERTIKQTLQQGIKAHKEGKIQEAEQLYRAILHSQPLHPDANHNLGVLAVSVNKTVMALPLLKKALEANPKIEQFWLSYIDVLIKEQQFENVKKLLKKRKKQGIISKKLDVLESQLSAEIENKHVNPTNPSHLQLNSLIKYYKAGRYSDAEKLALTITREFPKHQFGWKVLGVVLKQTGRIRASLLPSQKSVELVPLDSEAHNNLGSTFRGLGKLDEAEASFLQATLLKPDYHQAHNNLGVTLQELGRLDEAEESFIKVIALKPKYTSAYFNLGKVYKRIGNNSKATKYFEKTLELNSEDSLGATLELASLGKIEMPNKTPERYMQEFYKKKSNYWGNDKNQQKYRGHLLIENAFKKRHDASKKIDILDLGCGTGSLAGFLRPYARSLIGVDLSSDMLLKAEEIGLYDALHKKDLSQYLGEILNYYDIIIAAAVLIHFFDLDDIFSLVRDSLKIDGQFIFSVFEETQKIKGLNSFLMYTHSDDYVTTLANRLNLKITYRQEDIHEYHEGIPVRAIIYILKKNT